MTARSGVAIDLGTVNTLVHLAGRGLVVDEPSAIALSRSTGELVAVGRAADGLTGKEPQDVEVVHPLRDGAIVDFDAAAAMLQAFVRRSGLRRRLARARAMICAPAEASVEQRQAIVASARALRPRCTPVLIAQSVAAAAGAGLDLAAGAGAFVIELGGGTTDLAVLAGSHVVRARTLRLGGDAIDDAIAEAVRRDYGLIIGRNAARALKAAIGVSREAADTQAVGVDAASRTPRAQLVHAALVTLAIEPIVVAVTSAARELLSGIPPNLAEEIVRGKIRLSGGGALLPGMAHRIEEAANIATVTVDDPLRCVVRGAARMLEERNAREWRG